MGNKMERLSYLVRFTVIIFSYEVLITYRKNGKSNLKNQIKQPIKLLS